MDGKIVNLAKKIVRYKEHLWLYSDCEDRELHHKDFIRNLLWHSKMKICEMFGKSFMILRR